MRVLELTGVVICPYYEDDQGGPMIGGRYVIEALHETFPETRLALTEEQRRPLVVLLAHGGSEELYRGNAWACEGEPAYSSWTPASSPDMWVGGDGNRYELDLLSKLQDLDGQTVMLRVDDGPQLPIRDASGTQAGSDAAP